MEQAKHPYPHHPTRVIHVKGTDREIGIGHAEQLGEAVSSGMVRFYHDFWEQMFHAPKIGATQSKLMRAAKLLVDPLLLNRLFAEVPEQARERVRGVAEVTGIGEREQMTALVLPDLFPLLEGLAARLFPQNFVRVCLPRFGCSSFIFSGRRFLHGRNLDFPGVAYWDRYQVIQCTTRPNRLKYIGFTTAGVPIAGITGINEARISVSLHQHYCRSFAFKGQLPFVIGEEILSRARTLSEALEILKNSRVATSWAFVVTDGNRRTGFICETHPKGWGVRMLPAVEKSLITHSNFFQTKECQPLEYAASARMNWDNYSRATRLKTSVESWGFEMTPGQAVQCVSDHYDPYWGEEKIINRTVSQVYNIQSLVVDPEKLKVYLAEGDCPIHLRSYREYDLGEIFAGRDGRTDITFPGYGFQSENKRLAKEAYILSFVAACDGKYEQARKYLLRSLESDFCPEVAVTAGVVHMKLREDGTAVRLLSHGKNMIEEKVLKLGKEKFPPEYFETLVYLARAYDLQGQREKALALYEKTVNHRDCEDTHLRRVARAARPYKAESLSRILMPYSTYVPFQ